MVIGHIYLPYTRERCNSILSYVIYLAPVFILPKGFFVDGFTMSTENIIILFWGIVQCLIAYGIGRVVYEIPYLRLLAYGKMS